MGAWLRAKSDSDSRTYSKLLQVLLGDGNLQLDGIGRARAADKAPAAGNDELLLLELAVLGGSDAGRQSQNQDGYESKLHLRHM